MALDLYLVVLDSTGAPIKGQSQVVKLTNPLRGNAQVTSPFAVASYSFGATAPFTAGTGGGAGKLDPAELVVDMIDDAAAATLFRYIATGKRFKSIDVLAVESDGRTSAVVAAAGVGSAVLTALQWNVTAGDGLTRRLQVDGQTFSVGSATQNPDGSYSTFAFATYDTTKGTVT